MKRITNRKFRLNFQLKLYRKGQEVVSVGKQIKSKIIGIIEANSFEKAYLFVGYGNGFHNDGDYYTKETLMGALNAFTEKALLDQFSK